MSLILIISLAIRLVALGWSIILLQRVRDWRMGFLTVILGLMALRQTLTLLTEKESWAISFTGHMTELPGLAVSIIAFLAVFFLERIISERKRTEKRIEKDQLIAIPWRIYFLISTVGLIVVTMIGLSFYTGIRMNATYAPLIHASMEIKQEAALAHLWFEEIITGDRKEDIRVVWEHLDQADWYAQAMLEGGISPKGTFIPLDDAEMRQKIRDVQKNLIEFRDITHRRLIAKETAGIGTEIEQHYDAIFKTFIDQADKVETRLQQIMAQDLHDFQLLQIILIIASIILTLIIGIAFHLYYRRQAEDFLTIDKVNKNLEKEVVERKKAEEQILRQSAVLKAINKVFQEALVCETDEEVAQTCLAVAEELTGSKFGLIGEVNQSGRFDTIALSDPGWEACRMPKSEATGMIKNMEIRGIWSRVLKDEQSLLVNDPTSHPEQVGTPEGHPSLTSFLGVPLKHAGRTIGMFALANKESGYDLADQQDMETLSVAFVEALMRKRAEDYIQHLQSILRAIRDVNQLIVHEKNRQKLLQGTCEILSQSRNYKLVWIGLVKEETKDVLPAAQAGFDEGYLKSVKITWDDSETGQGPTGTAIKTRKPAVMRDIASDSCYKPWRKEALKRGYASSVAVPLIHEGMVWGALNVYATIPNSFNEEEIKLLLEVAQDISFALHIIELEKERKQAEEITRDQARLLDLIFEHSLDNIVLLDKDYNFIRVSETYAKACQRDSSEFPGHNHFEFYPSNFKDEADEAKKGKYIYQKSARPFIFPDHPEWGTTYWDLGLVPILDEEGEIELFLFTLKDVTERIHAEDELQKRRDENTRLTVIAKERGELQDWINTFDTLVGKFDPDGKGIIFNDAPIKAGGLTRDDVVSKYFPDTKWWTHSETERARIIECFEKAKAGTPSRIETNFRGADGTPVPIIFDCQPVMDDEGEVKYITAEGRIIIDELELRNALKEEKESLEIRVKERTSELVAVNKKLRAEITERKRAEEQLTRSYVRLRSLSTHLQSVREEERTQIAREIHDELGQILTALKMDLSWLGKKLPKEQKSLSNKTKSMSNLIDSTIKTVKRISMELRPGLLDDLGLLAAIEWQAEEFQKRTGVSCQVRIDTKDIIINRDLSTAIFRIFQETLTNVTRHANATEVEVRVQGKRDSVVLNVKDNGKGITEEQISDPKSFGLIGMYERMYPWGGTVNITGKKSKGTIVTVKVPFNNNR